MCSRLKQRAFGETILLGNHLSNGWRWSSSDREHARHFNSRRPRRWRGGKAKREERHNRQSRWRSAFDTIVLFIKPFGCVLDAASSPSLPLTMQKRAICYLCKELISRWNWHPWNALYRPSLSEVVASNADAASLPCRRWCQGENQEIHSGEMFPSAADTWWQKCCLQT